NGADCIQISGGPTTGGADQQQKIEVQDNDFKNAQNTMEQDLKQQIMAEFGKGTHQGEKLLVSGIQWKPSFDADHKVGDDVNSFNANLTESATAYYYRPGDVSRAITTSLNKKVPTGQEIAGNLTTSYQVTATQAGHLTFAGKASGFVAPRLNSDAIKSQVAGRSPSAVKQD